MCLNFFDHTGQSEHEVWDILHLWYNIGRILLDDTDITGTVSGGAYAKYGIDTQDVTFVVVRPDGYVGMIAPSSALMDLQAYFASFLIPHSAG